MPDEMRFSPLKMLLGSRIVRRFAFPKPEPPLQMIHPPSKRGALAVLFLLLLALHAVAPRNAAAQEVLRGVIWTPPADVRQAEEDLYRMRQAGIEAVRTSLIRDPRLLRAAEIYGIMLFQDLPYEGLSAAALLDSLPSALQLVELLGANFAGYPAARHFGLARLSDTSDEAACAFFTRLREAAREFVGPDVRVYYTTYFVEQDTCGDAVDFVLVDAVHDQLASDRLRRWREAHPGVPAGAAAVGTWIRSDAPGGVRRPNTPEAQARHLEIELQQLFEADPAPVAVFVRRWRDVASGFASPAMDVRDPYARRFGLLQADGTPRPALDVVTGIYTGHQTAFAFDAGREPVPPTNWPLLFGWAVFLIFGISYASGGRFRMLVSRYFFAHGLYQEGVRDGRELQGGAVLLVLTMISMSVGVFAAISLETLRTEAATAIALRWFTDGTQVFVARMIAQSALTVMLVALVYAGALILWSGILLLLARGRHPIGLTQSLALVVWPQWPLVLALAIVMVAPAVERSTGLWILGSFAAIWLFVTLVGAVRTVRDYTSVTRVPAWRSLLAVLLNPSVLGLIALGILLLQYRAELAFIGHLLTRS
jgi:hypothetical protein